MKDLDVPLVSIITPCYNGESYIHRFLISVLQQTYSNIQLILINDGSTDRTEEVIESYKSDFLAKKSDLIYIKQNNAGQASAINQGLKYCKGKYVTWADSDDFLSKDSILKRVEFLERNRQYDFVVCDSLIVDKDMNVVGERKRLNKENDNLFDDMIFEKNAIFGGAYLVKTEVLKTALVNNQIYNSRAGQNWQLILPIAYDKNYAYLNEYLFYIFAREGSHSRKPKTFSTELKKFNDHNEILNKVVNNIKNMDSNSKKIYEKKIRNKYLRKKLKLAAFYYKSNETKTFYNEMKEYKINNLFDFITYLEGTLYPVNKIIKFLKFIINKLLR
ncbi:glycosyltransferase family 2 protein [Marinilactibacillus psychrotolerans]|uniref:glycosyltransferase family 2 protein n=1 Tax=Marinilactibacillus psychrotolerans TaxID=191770 RepID=UPI0039B06616